MYRLCSLLLVTLLLTDIHIFPIRFSIIQFNLGLISTQLDKKNAPAHHAIRYAAQPVAAVKRNHDSLIFVGDVLLARNVEFLMRTRSGNYPFLGFAFDTLSSNPAVFGNFEAAVPREHQPTPIRQIDFSVATWTLPYANLAGFTHFSLANNHAFDFGPDGFDHTVSRLNEDFVAFGDPLSVASVSVTELQLATGKVAIIALNALQDLDLDKIVKILSNLESSTDKQIVYIHWGEEYEDTHSKQQRKLAEFLITHGSDLIIGHHPHVVQDIDLINGVPVFYSLGNYIFDQYFSKSVQEGLVTVITHTHEFGITLIPVSSQVTFSQPRPLSIEKHDEFLKELADRSHPELKEYISSGYVPLDVQLETSEKVAMMHTTNQYVQ